MNISKGNILPPMLETIHEKERDVPIIEKVEVLVVGGGPAGICAAVAAARNGAKTLLIEHFGFLGGMAATGLPLHAFKLSNGSQIIKGIGQEIVDRLEKIGGTPGHKPGSIVSPSMRTSTAPVDPEAFKRIAVEILEDSSVELLLYTLAVDCIVENSKVKGVIIESKSGRQAIVSDIVVDCSGDGDIAARCGAPFKKGRDKDGLTQPPSLMFVLANVDTEESDKIPRSEVRQLAKKAHELGELPPSVDQLWFFTIQNGIVSVNGTRVNRVDGTEVKDLTRAELESRKQIPQVIDFLKKYIPGFKSAILVGTGPIIGIRETRRIQGDYILNADDIFEARQFEDQIAKSGYEFDIHNPEGAGVTIRYVKNEGAYGIPFRCLLPKKIENLLVAGRCISTTYEAHSSIRVMGPCMAMGQAAGTAAALAVNKKITPRQLDVQELRRTLLEQGVIL